MFFFAALLGGTRGHRVGPTNAMFFLEKARQQLFGVVDHGSGGETSFNEHKAKLLPYIFP